jgi:nicotinamide-nucleotide amidase
MKAILLSVGDELVSGQTVDTNSAYLARRLGELGIFVIEHRTVADDPRAIAQAVVSAAAVADVVLVTGGLGPTADDLTRQALAAAMGCELVLDRDRLTEIEEFFHRRNRTMPPANQIQAMVPAGAQSLPNTAGTAPGIAARVGGADVYALPGVPHEMQAMFDSAVAPRLRGTGRCFVHRLVHCFGEGESDIAGRLTDLMARGKNPAVGTTVSSGLVTVRVVSAGANRQEAAELAEQTVAEINRRLGSLVVGVDEQTLPAVVGQLLRQARATLATAESCTGGFLGQLITSAPGSSDYYLGGVIAYSDRLKRDSLDVPAETLERFGTVSEQVAAAMADRCRKRLSADWALGVTGIAGPGGGSAEKPVGLVYVGLASPAGTTVHKHLLPGTREVVRLRAALTALNHLRLALMVQKAK